MTTTPAPTPTPTPIPTVFEFDPLVVLSFDAVEVGVSEVVADDLVCMDADAVVAVVVGAIPAVAVTSGSGKVNRSTLESLQQSSAEQQYEVEFLPQRITHSPPVTLSLGANHVSTPDSSKSSAELNSIYSLTDSPATQYPGHLFEDQVLSVHVPRISCKGFPVVLSYHPCGWQSIFAVQMKPCVQHTLTEAVLLQGTSLDTEPSGL